MKAKTLLIISIIVLTASAPGPGAAGGATAAGGAAAAGRAAAKAAAAKAAAAGAEAAGARETVIGNEKHSGILEKHRYECCSGGSSHKEMYIYLPEEYYESTDCYPVVYLLHGANGNELSWIKKGKILSVIDSLTEHGDICECIYVFPDMNRYCNDYDYIVSEYKETAEAFFNLNGSAEYSFINDAMMYVDEKFRTLASKEYRAIAGLSLGGLQTLYISANLSDSFEYIGLFSPIIYPPLNCSRHSFIYERLEDKLEKQFAQPPSLYLIMMGEKDPFYNSAFRFSKYLEEQKFRSVFVSTTGGHTWDNWTRYCLLFLKKLWNVLPEHQHCAAEVVTSDDICPTNP